MKRFSKSSALIIAMIVFLPFYFMIAAFGTKFGIWSYKFSLGTLIGTIAPWLLGAVALVSAVLLVVALLRKPRGSWFVPAMGIAVPLLVFAMLATARGTAGDNPIHDVSTDTATPPEFSAETIAARSKSGANALNDYQAPLGELEMYSSVDPQLAIKSHAQIINDNYAELAPLPLGGASQNDAVAAVAAAMAKMGFQDIRTDAQAGRVEGVAETFWFGFKDDVVARIGENEIDFRSVSRVGRSDLGANAKRIAELRELVAKQIGQR
jgi:uncharacterized protein (DUF1499 family)